MRLSLLRGSNVRSVHFTAKQQTAPALLPMRSERRQVQHHERAARFAVGCSAAEGGLEEVGQLFNHIVSMFSLANRVKPVFIPSSCDKAREPLLFRFQEQQ